MSWFLGLFSEHQHVLDLLAQSRLKCQTLEDKLQAMQLDSTMQRARFAKAEADAVDAHVAMAKSQADAEFFKSWCAKLETRLEEQIKEHRADLHKLSDWQGLVTTGRTVFNAAPALPERPAQHLDKVQPRRYAGDIAKEQTRKFNESFFAKEQEEYHRAKHPKPQEEEVEAVPV